MKAKAISLYFEGRNDREVEEYNRQLDRLKEMYADEVCFMESVCIGSKISSEADIVIIPQLFGAVFKESERLKAIQKPVMILTSEFGTVEMWDWEIVAWLRDELKMNVFFPYNCEIARVIFRSLAAKKLMGSGIKFLMFQDEPGEGMQAYLFKKFYWWDKSCTELMENAFGIKILYK